jgi:putative transposase
LEIGPKEGIMKGKKYSAEQIVSKLREADVLLGKGQSVGEVCRHLQITDVTYYRWRKEFGGLSIDQARRLKELEAENARLRKVIADLSIDNAILKEVSRGKF